MLSETPRQVPRSLGGYIEAIVTMIADNDAHAADRLQLAASDRRALITLDGESVEVSFDRGRLLVGSAGSGRRIDGTGGTDRSTVLDLLTGRLEASAAILDGLVRIEGAPDAVTAILLIVEIVLDAAPRMPSLQQLSDEFVNDPSSQRVQAQGTRTRQRTTTAWYPFTRVPAEERILARLDLLPDDDG